MDRLERRRQFIERFQHELGGIVFDALTAKNRHDSELSLWSANAMDKIKKRIGQMFDELIPAPVVAPQPETPKPHLNGTVAPPQRRTA